MWVLSGQPKPSARGCRTALPWFCSASAAGLCPSLSAEGKCKGATLPGAFCELTARAAGAVTGQKRRPIKLIFLPIPALIAGINPPSAPPLLESEAGGAPSEPINYMEKAGGQAENPDVALTPPALLEIPRGASGLRGKQSQHLPSLGGQVQTVHPQWGHKGQPQHSGQAATSLGLCRIWAPGHTQHQSAWELEGTELLPPTLCGTCDPALLNARPFLTLMGALRQQPCQKSRKGWAEH